MNAALGTAGVMLGLAAAVVGAITAIHGLMRSQLKGADRALPYVWLLLAGAVLATAALERALLTNDFSLQYVADNHSRATPLLFTVSTLWAALEGSILLWGLVLAGYLAAMARRFRDRVSDSMVGWALVVGLVVAAFFFGLLLGPANPFRTVAGGVPLDGPGPNPLLQNHPLMAFHPPLLYLGYVGFTVPFAFGIAALVTGRLGEGWLLETRRWTLFAWGCLTSGIVLGAWWSYEVLGWGGYWAWDPVENASLLPWLTATAYLHSAVVQERRGMLRVWNLSLLSATFALTILGTFFTRSGVLDSVHAFTESAIGPSLLAAFAVVVVLTCALVFWRADRLGSPGAVASMRSREAAFLANNIVFAGFAFVVLLGTVFPLLAEAVAGERLSVGRPYFDAMSRPLGIALLFLMAVAPVLPWRGSSTSAVVERRLLIPLAVTATMTVVIVAAGARGAWVLSAVALAVFAAATAVRQLVVAARRVGFWRAATGRAGGGMVAHLGFAVVAVALVASQSAAVRAEVSLRPGESAVVAGHTLRFDRVHTVEVANRAEVAADITIDGEDRRAPALTRFANATDVVGTPSVRTTWREDVYLTLIRAPSEDGGPVVLSVTVQPLVVWLWTGGAVIVFGTALALVSAGPRARRPGMPVDEGQSDADGRTPVGVTT